MQHVSVQQISRLYEELRVSELVGAVIQRSASLFERAGYAPKANPLSNLFELCRLLISNKGEAFGMAAAHEALSIYEGLGSDDRQSFFQWLVDTMLSDGVAVEKAARAYLDEPDAKTLHALASAARPPLKRLIERLNDAPGATFKLVRMREHLLAATQLHPQFEVLDDAFASLFTYWFNKGSLELRRIDWQTSAEILEKIIQYEAVHALQGWDDLRRRIAPGDRCLYAFFHPRLPNEPLIFVEVALTDAIPVSIQSILAPERDALPSDKARVATFYSISNCHMGLRGIPLGSFLIKQVVSDLKERFAGLDTFVTLSPVPGFGKWLARALADGSLQAPEGVRLDDGVSGDVSRETGKFLKAACAYYLGRARDRAGRALDPVARFHLGNGARLEQINLEADVSAKGKGQSFGVMVNYLYALKDIEQNHEAYANGGGPALGRSVARLAASLETGATSAPDAGKVKALPSRAQT